MCGFVGAAGSEGDLAAIDSGRFRRSLHAIEHRGPDAAGEVMLNQAWLGFRRLSILDLASRSHQPMAHPSGVHMVFNGEIYNYLELRKTLEAKGHEFRTTGDSEVLLAGYVQWGTDVFRRANGMWAVAIVDPNIEGVILSRDRFGEKPLYLGRDDDGVWWFGSEPGSLRAAGVGSGRINRSAVASMLFYSDIEPTHASYFDGIEQVPAASVVHLRNGDRTIEKYWSTADELLAALDRPPVNAQEIREALVRAVEIRLRSDVPVGTSLSGGVDSTSIVACLREVDPTRTLHAFTASFPGHPGDEFARAKAVADRFDIDLHRVEPTVEGFMADLNAVIEHQGGPFDMPSVYAQWCVNSAAAQNNVTVLLDGQGADETWGGYAKYATLGALQAVGTRDTAALAEALRHPEGRSAVLSGASTRVLGYLGESPRPLLLAGLRRHRRSLMGSAVADVIPDDPIGHVPLDGPLQRAMVADIDRSILPRLLRYADRNSMAWSREVRLPFLDPDVVRLGLASDWKSYSQTGWSKLALRKAMNGVVPDDVLWRREKSAFDVPTETWLQDVKLQDSIAEASEQLKALEILTPAGCKKVGPWARLSLARFIENNKLTL